MKFLIGPSDQLPMLDARTITKSVELFRDFLFGKYFIIHECTIVNCQICSLLYRKTTVLVVYATDSRTFYRNPKKKILNFSIFIFV